MNTVTPKFCISRIAATGLILWFAISCNQNPIPEKNWVEAVPEYVPAIIIPGQNANISAVMRSEYIPFLEDISSSALATISRIENVPGISILLKGMAVFPTQSDDWKPLWIAEADRNLLTAIAPHFKKEFAENIYSFSGAKVHILHTGGQVLYAVQLNQWVLVSESSYAIEEALRTYLDGMPHLDMEASQLRANSLVMNMPHFDRWLGQSGSPRHRPAIRDAFKGTGPGLLQVNMAGDTDSENLVMTGSIPLVENRTSLIQSVSYENNEVILDRYIPVDAAAFGVFNHAPEASPPKDVPAQSSLDSLLLADGGLYRDIARTLHPSYAYVAFRPTGFLSVGESLYIRQLSDQNALSHILQRLAADGFTERDQDMYTVDSRILADLLSSSLSDYSYFSLSVTHNGAVFSQRPGLTSRIRTDRSRRRVMYYDDEYTRIRQHYPDEVSGFFYAKSNDYLKYLEPVLSPNNYTSVISSRFDLVALSLDLDNSGRNLDVNLMTFRSEESSQPYRDRWVFPLDNTELTAPPVLASLGDGGRNELLFATEDSQIYALATDGTTIFQTDTGNDVPLGQPIVYDWYGNNQMAILIAAGNKVYAWNNQGRLLPNFPIEVSEQITAPLQVGDVSRDGRAELIVATADRKINVLGVRGENISGWPQSTNSRIETRPVFRQIDGRWSLWSFAENGLFAWNTDGRLRTGFPVFIESPFRGEPLFYDDNVVAAAADGYLYSIGPARLFADSLSREAVIETVQYEENEDDRQQNIQILYVANSPLVNTPVIQTLRIRNEETGNIREEMIITQSASGSVFVFNMQGQLRMTQSMGQPSDENHRVTLHDINNTGSPGITALAGFGRLYSWDSFTGERNQGLPTSAMQYPVFADLYGDGHTELIAKTREGLRCWTIMR